MSRLASIAGSLAALLLASGIAHADDPKFEYGKYEEKKTVEWQGTASAGLLLATGNANQVSFSAAAMALRNDGKNKLRLDVGGAYARATALSVDDTNGNGAVDPGEIHRITTTSTAMWNVKLRYDRFFTPNNALFVDGFAFGNEPAGKRIVGGGQAGYSRQLYHSEMQLFVAEIGYDFSYEHFVTGSPDRFYLHSLRLYLGYDLALSKDTAFHAGVEYLGNLNKYAGPYGADVSAFGDSRIHGSASLTTRIWKKIAFRLAFDALYDNVPAPLPTIGGLPFAAGFQPPAEKLDTTTVASLVVTFL